MRSGYIGLKLQNIFHVFVIYYEFSPKQNEFVCITIVGHGSESFAAFLNGVILQKNNAAVITEAVNTTHHESALRFR